MSDNRSRRNLLALGSAGIAGLAASLSSTRGADPKKQPEISSTRDRNTAVLNREPLTVPERKEFTVWVHGHSFTVEHGNYKIFNDMPNSIAGLTHKPTSGSSNRKSVARWSRLGWGAEFYIGPDTDDGVPRNSQFWVHYSIPTPFQDGAGPLKAHQLVIRGCGGSNPGVTVGAFHVWDGPNRIFESNSFANACPTGHFKRWMPNNNGFPTVNFGIGVSLLVRSFNSTWDHKLSIHSVGMEFSQ